MTAARLIAIATLAVHTFTVAAIGGPPIDVEVDLPGLVRASRTQTQVVVPNVTLTEDRKVDLVLERFTVTGPDTRFVIGPDDRPMDFDPASVTLLRGTVKGEPGSHVFLSISGSDAVGLIDFPSSGRRFNITSSAAGAVAVFEDVAGPGPLLGVPVCGVQADTAPMRAAAGGAITQPAIRQVQLAVDTDHEYFTLFGDADAAASYIVQLYGVVSSIYLRDTNARVELSFVRLWDTPADPYDGSDPFADFRDLWETTMGDVERDTAQLLTGRRNLPYGGVAYLEGLCNEVSYSLAGYTIGSFPSLDAPSTGHWDIVVTAHELGHNFGTGHTHDYGIDSCNSGTLQRGTIMSYCHTTPGGNANIDLRFHTVIQANIEGFFDIAACLVNDCDGNGTDDAQDIASGADDANGNGIPDSCEDCNGNGTLDPIDIALGSSTDLNGNGIPDDCEPDCNGNGVPDDRDIQIGTSQDAYGDGVPDECEADCNINSTSDYNEIQLDMTLDLNRNAILDSCEDCDLDGTIDLVALGGAHDLWVASVDNNVINQVHAGTGVLVRTGSAGALSAPHDVLVRWDSHVLVSNTGSDTIAEFDDQGLFVGLLVTAGAGGLSQPTGMTFTPGGTLLVASSGNDSVLEYDANTGLSLGVFVGSGAGGLSGPSGLAWGPDGNLFVSTSDSTVLQYNGATGAFIDTFVTAGAGGLDSPRGLVFKPDVNLLVASFGSSEILEYDGLSGAAMGRWDLGGLSSGFWALDGPFDLAIGPDGNVYVTSVQGNAAVHTYDIDTGAFRRSYYVLAAAGPLTLPSGLAFIPGNDVDCNVNLVPDVCDIAAGSSADDNGNGIPDECEAVLGDIDGDGVVGINDFLMLLGDWGPCAAPCPPACAADLDADCDVGINDFLTLLANWT